MGGCCCVGHVKPQWNPAVKTGSTSDEASAAAEVVLVASMEPGREDREYVDSLLCDRKGRTKPQWNPAVKTGSTLALLTMAGPATAQASMEPGREDREYAMTPAPSARCPFASMEPGREDREYLPVPRKRDPEPSLPQWNPAVKTGSTGAGQRGCGPPIDASMEPGREDREYPSWHGRCTASATPQWNPAVKTGSTGIEP